MTTAYANPYNLKKVIFQEEIKDKNTGELRTRFRAAFVDLNNEVNKKGEHILISEDITHPGGGANPYARKDRYVKRSQIVDWTSEKQCTDKICVDDRIQANEAQNIHGKTVKGFLNNGKFYSYSPDGSEVFLLDEKEFEKKGYSASSNSKNPLKFNQLQGVVANSCDFMQNDWVLSLEVTPKSYKVFDSGNFSKNIDKCSQKYHKCFIDKFESNKKEKYMIVGVILEKKSPEEIQAVGCQIAFQCHKVLEGKRKRMPEHFIKTHNCMLKADAPDYLKQNPLLFKTDGIAEGKKELRGNKISKKQKTMINDSDRSISKDPHVHSSKKNISPGAIQQ